MGLLAMASPAAREPGPLFDALFATATPDVYSYASRSYGR